MLKLIRSFVEILNHPLNKDKKIKTLFRIFWWKFNQLFLKIPAIIQITNGVKCICHTESSYGGLVVYTQLPEYYEMRYVLEHLKKNDIFIDIGANIGAVSLLAASKVGESGKVYAFEPDENVQSRLLENIRLNNFSGIIEVCTNAVSDSESRIKFMQEKTSEISHISYVGKSRAGNNNLVNSTTLTRFINDRNLNKVKMVKIDVEGAEMKVLLGMKPVFEKIESMLIEINKNSLKYGHKTNDTLKMIMKNGFNIYTFSDKGRLNRVGLDIEPNPVINILALRK